jgi:NitT/TauT family transport system permease protein
VKSTEQNSREILPYLYDVFAFLLVMSLVALLAWGSHQMAVPYTPGERILLSLDPLDLPMYALRTVLRMVVALALSLLFTFTYATIAAKNPKAERLLIPLLDILQSVPILGFLSITVTGFIALFPGSLLGVEAAAIFAIFTSQAWNMAFSFYQSLRTVPNELREASILFGLSSWQRFWKLETPFATPALIWNIMMSVSGGWFFVVASEAITVGKTAVTLPGIGSNVAQAIQSRNLPAVGWALVTMLFVILLYDQLLFRPLMAWAEKFKFELTESQEAAQSWILNLFHRAHFLRILASGAWQTWEMLTERVPKIPRRPATYHKPCPWLEKLQGFVWFGGLFLGMTAGVWLLVRFVSSGVNYSEIPGVFLLGFATLARVIILLAIACLLWVPLGVVIGLNSSWSTKVQPLVQFLAAFPANLLFPIAVYLIIRYRLSPEIWTAPLMILGTQ